MTSTSFFTPTTSQLHYELQPSWPSPTSCLCIYILHQLPHAAACSITTPLPMAHNASQPYLHTRTTIHVLFWHCRRRHNIHQKCQ